jgi:hypothetical protein
VAAPSPAGALLVQAYTVPEQADHDYKGHRIAAMKQIESAGRLVGVNVRGDGKAREEQSVSDAQLLKAVGLLQQAQPGGNLRKSLIMWCTHQELNLKPSDP